MDFKWIRGFGVFGPIVALLLSISACNESSSPAPLRAPTESQELKSAAPIDDDKNSKAVLSVVRQFAGFCLQWVDQPDKIEASAEALSWIATPPELAAPMAPGDGSIPWASWIVRNEGEEPVILAISDSSGMRWGGISGGKTCTISSPSVDPNEFHSAFIDALEFGPPNRQFTENGQRTTFWELAEKKRRMFILDGAALDVPGVTVTVSTIED